MEVRSDKQNTAKLNQPSLFLPWKISLLVIILGAFAVYLLFYLFDQWLNQPPARNYCDYDDYTCHESNEYNNHYYGIW